MRSITAFLLLSLSLVAGSAYSAPIFFQISGNNGAGSINGTPFTGAAWVFEIEMDDAASPITPAALPSINNAALHDYVNVRLSINGEVFVLALDPIKLAGGSITLGRSVGQGRDSVTANYMGIAHTVRLFGSSGDFYPAIVVDVNDLATFNSGVTINNSGADAFNSSSYIDFNSALSTSGDTIILDETSPALSGLISGSTSRTSVVAPPPSSIPTLPFTYLVLLSLCFGIISRKKLSKILA